jgi:spermidine synthase
MIPREVLDRTTTADGKPLELARERGHFILRVGGVPLMSSAVHGSEEAMAELAVATLAGVSAPRVLVGGLGMGFTLRAVLDHFGPAARITVAELLPEIVTYNRGVLAPLAGEPLSDPRVELFEGDVREPLARGGWDAVLLDVDNGPDALTADENRALYDDAGCAALARALAPGGVVVVWSAYESRDYERRLRRAGLRGRVEKVRARGAVKKGARHTLFVAERVRRRSPG